MPPNQGTGPSADVQQTFLANRKKHIMRKIESIDQKQISTFFQTGSKGEPASRYSQLKGTMSLPNSQENNNFATMSQLKSPYSQEPQGILVNSGFEKLELQRSKLNHSHVKVEDVSMRNEIFQSRSILRKHDSDDGISQNQRLRTENGSRELI